MTLAQTVLREIEHFMAAHKMKPTVFGRLACRDPHVVRWLRGGGGINSARVDQVRAFMTDYTPPSPPAAPIAQMQNAA